MKSVISVSTRYGYSRTAKIPGATEQGEGAGLCPVLPVTGVNSVQMDLWYIEEAPFKTQAFGQTSEV